MDVLANTTAVRLLCPRPPLSFVASVTASPPALVENGVAAVTVSVIADDNVVPAVINIVVVGCWCGAGVRVLIEDPARSIEPSSGTGSVTITHESAANGTVYDSSERIPQIVDIRWHKWVRQL
jgi:hypothetical protein